MAEVALNQPQSEAVAHIQGPLLVFAGAGSGKTRVITHRIANLIETARVLPYRILAVTFTNKAAAEMRSRLIGLVGESVARDLWVGTFHATCAKLLRVHGAPLGLAKNFVIYDASDQKAVVTRVLRELDLDEKQFPAKAMLSGIGKQKQEGKGPDTMSVDSYMDRTLQKVFTGYEAQLKAANAIDFEDIILYTSRLLSGTTPDLLYEGDKIRRRFDFVLVDEFQDTNSTQYTFLRELSREHRNLCVVGDDDQSIYRWRGADVRNIRGFKHDFKEALVVKLEQNYRSSKTIVEGALGVIRSSRDREPKELWTANELGDPIDVVATRDERDEAALVVAAVREAEASGITADQIAVFYRIHAQSRVLEEALRACNIPYQLIGGIRFYERAEIKDALSYMRALVNPRSDVDVIRIINTPTRGIGNTTVEKLLSFAKTEGISLLQALGMLDRIDVGTGPKKKLVVFRALMAKLEAAADTLSPAEFLNRMLLDTGYMAALEADLSTEGEARVENLKELESSLLDYQKEAEASGEVASISGFLERVTLQTSGDEAEEGAQKKVTLMTVHGAKGLEFEVVLLTGMEEEMFPYRGVEGGDNEELDEERRLAYVAITRARKRLVITHTQSRQIFGKTRWGVPSRFLSDIPSALVRHLRTGANGIAAGGSFGSRPSSAPPPPSRGSWGHPQAPKVPSRPPLAPGERFVDREYFAEDTGREAVEVRPGSYVKHKEFGTGKVVRVEQAAEPRVVAFFPGWGEKKVLLQYLE